MLISLSESVIDMLCSRPPSLQVLVVGLCRGKELATMGLASTASSSAGLETIEERELTRLVGAAVDLTLQRFELKLAQFAEMEEIVEAERRDLEKGRQQLFLDRLAFKKRAKDMETAFRQASLKTPEEGMRLMHEVVGGEREGLRTWKYKREQKCATTECGGQ
jgi:hypothetical protein